MKSKIKATVSKTMMAKPKMRGAMSDKDAAIMRSIPKPPSKQPMKKVGMMAKSMKPMAKMARPMAKPLRRMRTK